jgi:LmbE family N-acetylglucosaminyl deacetylase
MTDTASLGSIMGIWAHPDDETFASAGLMAAAVQNGQSVACVTATRGESGVQDAKKWPADQLGDIREQELHNALEILGIQNHHWLGYADGGCRDVPSAEAVSRLTEIVQRHRPDTIITFAPDGMTGHPDHQAVSSWARILVLAANWPIGLLYVATTEEDYDDHLRDMDEKLNIFYNIDQPKLVPRTQCDIVFELSPALCEQKCKALAAMPSQMSKLQELYPWDYLCRLFTTECFTTGL